MQANCLTVGLEPPAFLDGTLDNIEADDQKLALLITSRRHLELPS